MTDQYTVQFDGVRLTRLPAGRAEGFIWLTFVGRGEALRFKPDPEDHWRLRAHVTATWPSGAPADVVGGAASGTDGLSSFEMTFRDTGESSIELTYVGADSIIGQEVVALPT